MSTIVLVKSQNSKAPKFQKNPNNQISIWNFALGVSLAFGGLAFGISQAG
jgi:hypothetical protein